MVRPLRSPSFAKRGVAFARFRIHAGWMETTPDTAPVLARQIQDAIEQQRLTRVQIAARGGPQGSTVRNLLSGEARGYLSGTAAKVDSAMGWAPGSTLAIARGEAAEPIPAPAVEPIPALADGPEGEVAAVDAPTDAEVVEAWRQRVLAMAKRTIAALGSPEQEARPG